VDQAVDKMTPVGANMVVGALIWGLVTIRSPGHWGPLVESPMLWPNMSCLEHRWGLAKIGLLELDTRGGRGGESNRFKNDIGWYTGQSSAIAVVLVAGSLHLELLGCVQGDRVAPRIRETSLQTLLL
jgi:hypothetical protein